MTPGTLHTSNIAILVSEDLGSFLTKLNPTASAITYATYLTGSGNQNGGYQPYPNAPYCDCANGIAVDQAGNAYVAGYTTSTDFPTTLNAFQTQAGFSVQPLAAFVTKFDAAETEVLPLTTTTVKANQNPQMAEQPITFTATVQSSAGSIAAARLASRIRVFSTMANRMHSVHGTMLPWTLPEPQLSP